LAGEHIQVFHERTVSLQGAVQARQSSRIDEPAVIREHPFSNTSKEGTVLIRNRIVSRTFTFRPASSTVSVRTSSALNGSAAVPLRDAMIRVQ
jgi:hypothetical protein